MQYAATASTELLADRGVALSMAAVGKPEGYGYAGCLMKTGRVEEIDLSEYRNFADAYGQPGRLASGSASPAEAVTRGAGGVTMPDR